MISTQSCSAQNKQAEQVYLLQQEGTTIPGQEGLHVMTGRSAASMEAAHWHSMVTAQRRANKVRVHRGILQPHLHTPFQPNNSFFYQL